MDCIKAKVVVCSVVTHMYVVVWSNGENVFIVDTDRTLAHLF